MLACFSGEQAISSIVCDERALHYGDGIFTTMLVEDGQPQLWPYHLQRLHRDCSALKLEVPWPLLEQQLIVHCEQFRDAVCKIIISRGYGQLGYAAMQSQVQYYFCFFQRPEKYQYPLALKLFTEPALPNDFAPLVGAKHLNRLPQVLLQQQLAECSENWDEALLIDCKGMLVEAIASNIFFFFENCWHTPPLTHSGVQGVIRALVLERCEQQTIPVVQTSVHHSQLPNIKAMVLTNAVRGMRTVACVDAHQLDVELSARWIATLCDDPQYSRNKE